MKALLGTIAWILYTMLVILPILAKPKPPPPPKPVKYPLKTWKLAINKPATYTTLLASLRVELDSQKVCKIPSTEKSPTGTKAFVLVEITSLKNKKVTLAFRGSNVYYVGYMDQLQVGNKLETRANFVREDFKELEKSSLFSEAKIKSQLTHGGGYDDLERESKPMTREKLPLGVNSLSNLLDKISGADYNGKNKPTDIRQDLAKFALVAIQMIAEGTRYKYIEEEVKNKGTKQGNFVPDRIFLDLENNWGTISELVHRSSPNCGDVKVDKFPWDDIKPHVGLLKHKK